MLTLRELKYLVRDALFEGVEQDRQELIKTFPEQENDISRLGPKWIMWLMARFGPSAKFEEIHPFADALATVKSYSQRDAAISQKYNSSEQWRQAVDQAFPNRKWKNPADVMTMTADDMETLLAMSQRKKQNVDVSQVSNVEQDRIGKVGPWNLWMPTTKENSCQIAGYDPATMKPYTTWCTARTADSNLFYNYVGKEGVILFYLIKDDAKTYSDRLSIGFINGKPVLNGERGGISVDGDNNGLNEKSLRSLLGGHYDQIMATLQDVANKHQGKHPAQKKMSEAAQSVDALKSMLRGLSKDEQNDMLQMIAKQQTLSIEVAEYLCQVDHNLIRTWVAENPNTPIEILTRLAQDEDGLVRQCLATNHNAPAEILAQLAQDKSPYVRNMIACHNRTSTNMLTQLANDKEEFVRASVAMNHNTPVKILAQLAQDKDVETCKKVAENPNTPIPVLEKLAHMKKVSIRTAVARHKNLPSYVLDKLSNDTNLEVKRGVASNPNTTHETLRKLMQNANTILKRFVASNPNLPNDIIVQLMAEKDIATLDWLASNKNLSSEMLTLLASKTRSTNVLLRITQNPNTSTEVLTKLSQSKYTLVKNTALEQLQKRQQNENKVYERVLRRLQSLL